MTEENPVNVRKKANTYFFSKVVFNLLLIVLGAVIIAAFLRQMQMKTAFFKQEQNSRQALSEAVSILERNAEDAQALTQVFHDANQDMLDDLEELLTSGLFDSLTEADTATRSRVMQDMVQRSGVDYLFIMSRDGRLLMSPFVDYVNVDLVAEGFLTQDNLNRLLRGTRDESGRIEPALENNRYGYFYFYSMLGDYEGMPYLLVLGAEAATLDVQIAALKDVSIVLSRAAVGNNGFLFAVDKDEDSFLYFKNGDEVLTGKSARECGLSDEALQDGYSGVETINGVKYYCVSRTFGSSTVICAVAERDEILYNDRYVLFWSITGFVLVMLLCLTYAVIVRNDFVRHAVETEKKIFHRRNRPPIIFDISIFKKVNPLMIAGVLLIFGISFYTQTLLEISECIDNSITALDEVSGRYEESMVNRKVIQEYYNNRFLSKARLIAYLLEEDPSVLNEPTDRRHSYYDEAGNKHFILDDEGNPLRSVASSARLQELCDENDLEAIYIYDEDGHTIATSTDYWYFIVSHDPADQSYPFLQVIDGKRDSYVQEPMTNDLGEVGQYIGVAFTYYTSLDEEGNTVYLSHFDYETAEESRSETETKDSVLETLFSRDAPDAEEPAAHPITAHRAMLQIGMDKDLSEQLLASTELDYIFSSDMLQGGFMVLFDASEDHVCLYSPFEARIGMTAAEIGVPAKAFTGIDYYGFNTVNSITYFQYFRYSGGYFVATAIPRASMYQSRTIIALLTALTSLLLILFLSGTVTLTTEEEEMLYASMSGAQPEGNRKLDAAIFNIILPSGNRTSTTNAASRWDNRGIPWSEKAPEQKLLTIISIMFGIMIAYVVIAVLGANTFFKQGSVIQYILSGNWDNSPNIFAMSACALVLIFAAVGVAMFRIPVRLLTSLMGARGETVGHLLLSVVKYGGAIGAIFYGLYLIGMDSTSLLASAGVLSLVIGLGAQSLIKDIIAGIFIVFEGEFRVGDIVTISGFRGTVMDIGLRTTKILSPDGNVKIYNNSDISGVLNMTKEASLATCTISIEYGQDIDYVETVLRRDLPLLGKANPQILDGPTYAGVSQLGESGVDLLILCKCREEDIKNVSWYLNREVLQIFYRNDINVPFPNVTVSTLDASNRKTVDDLPPKP